MRVNTCCSHITPPTRAHTHLATAPAGSNTDSARGSQCCQAHTGVFASILAQTCQATLGKSLLSAPVFFSFAERRRGKRRTHTFAKSWKPTDELSCMSVLGAWHEAARGPAGKNQSCVHTRQALRVKSSRLNRPADVVPRTKVCSCRVCPPCRQHSPYTPRMRV